MISSRVAILRTAWTKFRAFSAILGVRATVKYLSYQRCSWMYRRRSEHSIRPKQVDHSLRLRLGSSDLRVFKQIFVECEYRCLDDLGEPGLIVDCGANVGYSSAYFLSRYPSCEVVAVEPEPGNFELLRRNLAAYGSRARSVRAAIWSHVTPLVISREPYRDGREWAAQVRLPSSGESAEVEGVDLATLLAASGHERISLLKMDIEGAEAVVFSKHFRSWLDRTNAIAIELHDDSFFGPASEIFFSAIDEQGFDLARSGELTICRRLSLDKQSA